MEELPVAAAGVEPSSSATVGSAQLQVADVGVERFNNDHQRLLFYIVEFSRLAERFRHQQPIDEEWDPIDAIFPRLEKYTQEHFQAEEELMRQHDYPLLTRHIAQHQELTGHLQQLKESVTTRHVEAIAALESFLFDWLTTHINQDDRQYRGCFQLAESRQITEKALFNEMISAEQLKRIIELSASNAVLLDLRTVSEQEEGIIPGSQLYPCAHNLLNRQDTEPFRRSFSARFAPEQFDSEQWYILICRSGPRAAIALEAFQEHDLPACELIGGIQEWLRQGFSLVDREQALAEAEHSTPV
ncbi:bacteriohemerythrin [Candidatus Magnetaquicoccus inordinatus]|uniref:bacteriohemerythrin n=1 Tax=Candidatus Magnetaquicoccus inordinatus TaxID=2496818 RepID=UPI00102CD458|nr:bacteriohemerythrin [Candidatus Magnetaquicoccus inordinatus]